MLTNPWVLAVLALVYVGLVGAVCVYGFRLRRGLRQWRIAQQEALPALHRDLVEQRLALQSAGLELDRQVRQAANRVSVGSQDLMALALGRFLVRLTRSRYAANFWAPVVARAAIGKVTTTVARQVQPGGDVTVPIARVESSGAKGR